MFPLIKSYHFSGDSINILNLFQDEPYLFFLDSSLAYPHLGRYSFIGFDPFYVFQDKGKNSLVLLRELFQKYKNFVKKPLPFFYGGLVGYFGYDFGLYLDNIRISSRDDLLIPDCFFGFYDSVIVIDHDGCQLHIVSTGFPETHRYLMEQRAAQRLEKISRRLSEYTDNDLLTTYGLNYFRQENEVFPYLVCNFAKEEYLRAVQKALEYIRKGDIYQVNLSQRFICDANAYHMDVNTLEWYRFLRKVSPSCFGGYLDGGHFQILSSSPERFINLKNNILQTRPMKGTRRRGVTKREDEKLIRNLLTSEKEKAELLMITDLERNDLGRVCRYGSIRVKALRTLEEYKTVFQTTSTIEGILQNDKDCFDVIGSCFPSGSVTGCPKIRAMEIIDELESVRRGLYTGSLGYVGFSGIMDFNVLIRTLLVKQNKIYFQVGGGIVADSNPDEEYNETLIKAKALCQTLEAFLPAKVEN